MAVFNSPNTKHLVVNELRVCNDLESYQIAEKMLGQGGFGRVVLAQRQSDNMCVALKFFGYARAAPDIVFINNEIMLMSALLGVPGVIQLQSIIYDSEEGFMAEKIHKKSYPIIAMEMIAGGDLFDRVTSRVEQCRTVSENSLAEIFRNAIIALDGIHKRGFIHRDLKLDNILLVSDSDNSPVKIIDFGFMCPVPTGNRAIQSRQLCGTHGYLAPESTYDIKVYSTKSDIWQMGCILYCLLCGHPAYHTDESSFPAIRAGKYCTTSKTYQELSSDAKDLLHGLFNVNSAKRFSIEEVLQHPWMHNAPSVALDGDYSQRVRAASLRQHLRKLFLSSVPDPDSTFPTVTDSNAGTMALIDEEESIVARKFFNVFDTNGDNLISKKELQVGVALLLNSDSVEGHQGRVAQLCPILTRSVDEMFDLMDANGDGNIDFTEFVAFYGEAVLTSTMPLIPPPSIPMDTN